MLTIYISNHCAGCTTALKHAHWLREIRPNLPVRIVNLDQPGAVMPKYIIGTPCYTWQDQVLYWGNPAQSELVERIDTLYAQRSETEKQPLCE